MSIARQKIFCTPLLYRRQKTCKYDFHILFETVEMCIQETTDTMLKEINHIYDIIHFILNNIL